MTVGSIFNYIEVTNLLLFPFLLYINRKVDIQKKTLIFIPFLFLFITISFLLKSNLELFEVLKILSFFIIIYFGTMNPQLSKLLLIIIALIHSLVFLLEYRELDKYSAFPFIFIFSIFISLIFNKIKTNHKKINLFIYISIFLEFGQALYTGYRGQILLCIITAIVLISKVDIKNNMSKIFLAFPLIYIAIMYVIGFTFYEMPMSYFTPTASNIERSSMIFWIINHTPEYLFYGVGADSFESLAGIYKIMYHMGYTVPNDPHSFLLRFFVLIGTIPTLMIFVYLYNLIGKTQKLELSNDSFYYASIAGLQALIIFTMHPFDAYSRLIVGLTLGIIISYNRILRTK